MLTIHNVDLKIMNQFNDDTELKRSGHSRLFNHYRQFFDDNVVEKFRRRHDLDKSFKGHSAMMREIESHIQENVKYYSKADYQNLVDTLKLLAENDV
tara:strand:- start:52 stop:342 length:291 start_codon:yes stop_codon:yes gene_type:complete